MVAWKGSEAHLQTGAGLCNPPTTTTQGLEPGAGGPFWVPRNVRAPLVCGHAWACLAQGLGTWGSMSRRSKPVPTPRSRGLLSTCSGKQASGSLEPATELTGWVVPGTWDVWGTGKGPQPPLAPTGTPPHPTAPGSRTLAMTMGEDSSVDSELLIKHLLCAYSRREGQNSNLTQHHSGGLQG